MGVFFGKKKSKGSAAPEQWISDFELPHFPGAVFRALEVIRNEASTLEEIAEALHADPAVSVRVLKLVNSAAFGMRQAVEDLAQAAHILGRSAVEELVISVAVRSALPQKPLRG